MNTLFFRLYFQCTSRSRRYHMELYDDGDHLNGSELLLLLWPLGGERQQSHLELRAPHKRVNQPRGSDARAGQAAQPCVDYGAKCWYL